METKQTDGKVFSEQLDMFDLIKIASDLGNSFSSDDIEQVIERLQSAKRAAKKREEDERKRKMAEERARREREEAEQREAHIRDVTSMDLPMDWDNVFNSDERAREVHADSIPDALILSLSNLGRVDIEYISAITGSDYKTVICALKGSIYQNPDTWGECFYKGWETAEEYLSGNLLRKWRVASKANKEYDGYFSENIRAIEKVLPPAVPSKDIYITLGSPWVPPDVIDDFIFQLFGDPFAGKYYYNHNDEIKLREAYKTIHDEITGTWEIPGKGRYEHSVGVRKTYGTGRMEALYILEKTLNMKSVAVTDETVSLTNVSGKKRVVNKAETLAAIEKQQKLIREFQKWVWSDDNRRVRLESIFENNFSCVRRRLFDGSFLTFPGMSPSVQLYPYQKDAAARIIFSPNTLLAHDVGAGKTYVMIAAGQELKRMGLSKKNLYVVPNNITGQWESIFKTMYPTAKLLIVTPNAFTPKKRESVLEKIRDDDYDGIIMAYSCFEQIPLSKDYYIDELESKKKAIADVVKQKGKATSRLRRKQEAIEKALSEMSLAMDGLYDTVFFDELGITRLFVDEAHNYKNVPIETKTDKVLGINGSASKKCRDMMDKVHMVQKANNGAGVVLATGTPITNSITDVYVMQQYLQSGELAMLDLQSFDSWIGMFAEKVTEFEIDVDTTAYRLATRFSKFHNLPELTALLSSIADFHPAYDAAGMPGFDGYSDALISKTPGFAAYLSSISSRADDVRSGLVSRREDNMLKITSDGRKAALDLRLVDPTAVFTYQSKVARCAENVANIFFKTSSALSTQLVFCDTSTPKSGFNLYSELRRLLIQMGVPYDQIAFIHDVDSEKERALLFAKMRRGDIRILIGSTFKLGLGVNIQDKLIALHHLDVPWRPADMTQREGRILRQGNINPKVMVFRYITEGSFDAYSWQLLETKQRFISSLLSGSLADRSGSDIEDTVLDYAEVKALAVGNPLIKERVEAANELTRYMTLQRKLVEARMRLEKEKLEMPGVIRSQIESIENCGKDIAYYEEWKMKHPPADDNRAKKDEAEKRRGIRESISSAVRSNVLETRERELMTYRGFRIILPANMTVEKPYVWLSRNGRYYVELGDTEVGNLIRIDNFLESLNDHLAGLNEGLEKLKRKEREIEAELSKDESFSEQIEEYKKKVETIDRKLGVKKQ
ncbi:MAG: DEAD/DEAH box helicase family protein [Clostridiales bacterium]|nr:DEAD/DEAH box helicase family protein [Clostridiales bacterium]